MSWRIVCFPTGTYGAMNKTDTGIEYLGKPRREFATFHEAERAIAEHVHGRRIPKRLSPSEFARITQHVYMRPKTKGALERIMVQGGTWREAATAAKVAESTILRAMRRLEDSFVA